MKQSSVINPEEILCLSVTDMDGPLEMLLPLKLRGGAKKTPL